MFVHILKENNFRRMYYKMQSHLKILKKSHTVFGNPHALLVIIRETFQTITFLKLFIAFFYQRMNDCFDQRASFPK